MKQYVIRFKMEGVYKIKAESQERAEEMFYDLDLQNQFDYGVERSEIMGVEVEQ